jgi:hypothetical protein
MSGSERTSRSPHPARDGARDAPRDASRDAPRDALRDAPRDAPLEAPRDTSPEAALDATFADILASPDRDSCPGARPVISYSDSDPASFLGAIESVAVRAVTLERRGAFHGEWAELDPDRLPPALRPDPRASDPARLEGALAQRWHATRPIVLPGIALPLLESAADEIDAAADLRERVSAEGGLRRFLDEQRALLDPDFRVLGRRAALADKERDIEKVMLESFAPNGRGRPIEDLWLKSGWLSTHDDDASLRLRVSYGAERDDDAARDILRHRLVAELASRLVPGAAAIADDPLIGPLIDRLAGESVLFTQAIAYWNAPQGGALFHHDSFAEDDLDNGAWRQLGVCYVQLSGATAWLALSTEDLASRIAEFVEALDEGALPWVRAQLFDTKDPASWARVRALAEDRARMAAELALPGQGTLGPLVNRGPEFTSFLADAGHGYVLEAGDAILLPNRNLRATCLHSVFCASDEIGYSVSLALRPDRDSPEDALARESRARRQ